VSIARAGIVRIPSASRKTPRRRATQERSQQTVAAILEAASQVLRSEGYTRTTTNRIAERAGVSVGSVYQYFDGKDGVLEALIQRETQVLASAVTRYPIDPTRPLEEVLRELLILAVTVRPHAPELFRHLGQVPNAALGRAVGEARIAIVEFTRNLLEQYRDQLRISDLELAAFMIVASAEGIGMNARPDLYNEDLVEPLVTMLSRYLLELPGGYFSETSTTQKRFPSGSSRTT
jgi:AcrR family transcriptional regulator